MKGYPPAEPKATYMYECIYVCMYVMYICMYIYIYISVCVCVYIYIHSHTVKPLYFEAHLIRIPVYFEFISSTWY